MTSYGFKCLIHALKSSQLKSLNLSLNEIVSADANALANGLIGSQLESLDLCYNRLNNAAHELLINSVVQLRVNRYEDAYTNEPNHDEAAKKSQFDLLIHRDIIIDLQIGEKKITEPAEIYAFIKDKVNSEIDRFK